MTPQKDPFCLSSKKEAIELGKEVYYITASCQACHRGYVDLAELDKLSRKVAEEGVDELDEDFFKLKLQGTEHNYQAVPPDFTFHEMRSVRGKSVEDIYFRLLAGVGGTSMPAWYETISDKEIWAVSYYVQSLMELRNSPERKELIKKLGQ